jgi:8-oxo-dGTP pyrophosphatase MutT (NUDIX family)
VSETAEANPYTLAATVIVMRETHAGPPELLMLERASSLAFAGGALVFPGGRVEPGDWAMADALLAHYPGERDQLAQCIAGIRETIEEVGIAVGVDPIPEPDALAELRCGLAEGGDFADLLAQASIRLDPALLTPFARWRPAEETVQQLQAPPKAVRRFDTRFFLAAAPHAAVETPDGTESVRTLWASASTLLEGAETGHHHVIFPTWCNLGRLAQFDSLDHARADAALHAHHLSSGRIQRHDDVEWVCIEEGRGYPVTRRLLSDELRR